MTTASVLDNYPGWVRTAVHKMEAESRAVVDILPEHKLLYVAWPDMHQACKFPGYSARQCTAGKGWADADWYFGDMGTQEACDEAFRMQIAPEDFISKFETVRGTLEPMISDFSGIANSTKRRRHYDYTGDELCVDRYITRTPECWETRKRGKKRSFVRFAVQFGYTATAEQDVFIKNAALACAASDILERLGYIVEIVGVGWGTNIRNDNYGGNPSPFTGWEAVGTFPIKHADQPLDVHSVLLTGVPALFRSYWFGNFDMLMGQNDADHINGQQTALCDESWERLNASALVGQTLTVKEGSPMFDTVLTGFLQEAMKAI
jgi:hypothetical protein